ncbi:MAG: class I SAM-dependent methyltransferase [Burkholderiaceae bacterium]
MSLTLSSIRYLSWVSTRLRLQGPVLLLGRQMVFGCVDDVAWAIRKQGREPLYFPDFDSGPNIAGLDASLYGHYTNDICVAKMIVGNVEVDAIDIDPYQGATLIHDLAAALPQSMRGKYGLVLDAGTLEHIFDVKAVLDNLASCLRPGGVVVHMSPANGYLDHGYFQISPSLFGDYYASKNMAVDNITLVEQPVRRTNHTQWNFWQWDPAIKRKKLLSETLLSTFCAARRVSDHAKSDALIQKFGDYLRESGDSRDVEIKPWGLRPLTELDPVFDHPVS